MKTKAIKNIFALALILFTVLGCGRYEEGPCISFRSVEKRIYGSYHVSYISKNCIDETNYWNKYFDLIFSIKELSPADISDHIGMQVDGYIDSCGSWKRFTLPLYSIHYWKEEDDETVMIVNHMYDTTMYPERLFYPLIVSAGTIPRDSFHISRLTNEDLWLFHSHDNDVYNIHFRKQI